MRGRSLVPRSLSRRCPGLRVGQIIDGAAAQFLGRVAEHLAHGRIRVDQLQRTQVDRDEAHRGGLEYRLQAFLIGGESAKGSMGLPPGTGTGSTHHTESASRDTSGIDSAVRSERSGSACIYIGNVARSMEGVRHDTTDHACPAAAACLSPALAGMPLPEVTPHGVLVDRNTAPGPSAGDRRERDGADRRAIPLEAGRARAGASAQAAAGVAGAARSADRPPWARRPATRCRWPWSMPAMTGSTPPGSWRKSSRRDPGPGRTARADPPRCEAPCSAAGCDRILVHETVAPLRCADPRCRRRRRAAPAGAGPGVRRQLRDDRPQDPDPDRDHRRRSHPDGQGHRRGAAAGRARPDRHLEPDRQRALPGFDRFGPGLPVSGAGPHPARQPRSSWSRDSIWTTRWTGPCCTRRSTART